MIINYLDKGRIFWGGGEWKFGKTWKKKLEQILSIVSPFFSCHHPFLRFILQFTFLPSPLPCSSFFIQCYAPPPSFPGLSCFRRFFFASSPEHCVHAPPSLATSTQVKASNSFTLLSVVVKKQNILMPSSVILEVLHPWSALLLHEACAHFLYAPPSSSSELTVPSSTSPPDLPLYGSASLLLSSLCRWRSRWLARVRELSTLIFIWPAATLGLGLCSLFPSLQPLAHSSLPSPRGK